MLNILTAVAGVPLRLLTLSINTRMANYAIQIQLYLLRQTLRRRGLPALGAAPDSA